MTKTILITGASSGIGAACVEQASKLNLNVIATARSKSKLELLEKQFKNVQIIVADIATETGRNIIHQSAPSSACASSFACSATLRLKGTATGFSKPKIKARP